MPAPNFDVIVSLAKRRGFVFPSSEIYGGMAGFWDYGPLGVELKNNVKAAWWRHMVQLRDDVVGIEASIIMNPRVWEASGHVAGFSDPMVDCRNCKLRFREDDLKGPPSEIACPNCGSEGLPDRCAPVQPDVRHARRPGRGLCLGRLPAAGNGAGDVRAVRQRAHQHAAQAAVRDRADGPSRSATRSRRGTSSSALREFEQMEMEFFVHPRDEDAWFAHWVDARHRWWTDVIGIDAGRLRLRPHDPDELSHYSKQTTDIEYEFPIGWSELEGVADRTDYDLRAHASASGRKLEVFDEQSGEHIVPYVIEPAMGVERAVLTALVDGYTEEQLAKETRVVLRLRPELAPVKAAVLPLLRNRPELVERARRLTADLKQHVAAMYDDTASIGKLYRRQDEIGTPYCITVDVESLDDGAATIRERDSMTQERVAMDLVPARVADLVAGRAAWEGVPRERSSP